MHMHVLDLLSHLKTMCYHMHGSFPAGLTLSAVGIGNPLDG